MLRACGTLASSVSAVQMSAFALSVLLAPLAESLPTATTAALMMIIGDAGSVLGLGIILAALTSPRPSLAWVCTGAISLPAWPRSPNPRCGQASPTW